MKRAKELELVVVDKRAKRKESRVLDSNGESGALGGLLAVLRGEAGVCGGGGERDGGGVGWGASVMNFNGKGTNDWDPPSLSLSLGRKCYGGQKVFFSLYVGVRMYVFICSLARSIWEADMTAKIKWRQRHTGVTEYSSLTAV